MDVGDPIIIEFLFFNILDFEDIEICAEIFAVFLILLKSDLKAYEFLFDLFLIKKVKAV